MKNRFSNYSNREEYRRIVHSDLCCWHTEHKDTELLICADSEFSKQAYRAVVSLRNILDDYIMHDADFGKSFVPVEALASAPDVVLRMCAAAKAAHVGPMAAVAGAFAAHAGDEVLKYSSQVVVENGGDVYLKTKEPGTIAIYAGASPISMKIGIRIDSEERPVAVCTSAGSIGHSTSFGKADAAVVVSHDACLADACATRLGNEIKQENDIQSALEMTCGIDGVIGAVAVMGEVCGAMGEIELKTI